jgi:hypothetical protein
MGGPAIPWQKGRSDFPDGATQTACDLAFEPIWVPLEYHVTQEYLVIVGCTLLRLKFTCDFKICAQDRVLAMSYTPPNKKSHRVLSAMTLFQVPNAPRMADSQTLTRELLGKRCNISVTSFPAW